jgi:alkylation response protein AidB-like acyl-CoA dehydrogenase
MTKTRQFLLEKEIIMPSYTAPLRDIRFLLNEFLNLEHYKTLQGFEDITPDLTDSIIEEGAKLCSEVLFPLNQSGDSEGLHYKDGTVTMPKGFREAYQTYIQGGWTGFTCDPAYGGQGLPEVLSMPVTEMICSANLAFGLTPGLTHGAYNAIHTHATEELKQRYLPKLVEGTWTGVMCLTEPQCGTDLGLIRTQAVPAEDGSYRITGTKIFISAGEHDLSDNIIHLVLAKLPDAPKGVKGISLFLVPKILVNEDGSLGERNGVACGAIEHKMGIHASPTCMINYDNAVGYLVGAPHKGLRAMFTMMNEARLYVGVQGLGLAEVAYQNALAYARERLQGRSLTGAKQPDKAADPLMVHPDIRRMLLTMKSFNEGGRALVMLAALKVDISKRSPDPIARQEAEDFVQLITPILKASLTDGGHEMTNLGMQVLGGYGYIKDYGMEQYARDARIAQIYEGTNGIQALDLVGRKLPAHAGRYLRSFFHPATAFIEAHRDNPAMAEFTKPLYKAIGSLQNASLWIADNGMRNPDNGAAASVEYLRMFSLCVMGYLWAQMAEVALKKLESADDKAFYQSKIATARFYMQKVLPEHYGLLASIVAGAKPVMEMDEALF